MAAITVVAASAWTSLGVAAVSSGASLVVVLGLARWTSLDSLSESLAESLPHAASTRAPAAMIVISFFVMMLLAIGRPMVAGLGLQVWGSA